MLIETPMQCHAVDPITGNSTHKYILEQLCPHYIILLFLKVIFIGLIGGIVTLRRLMHFLTVNYQHNHELVFVL